MRFTLQIFQSHMKAMCFQQLNPSFHQREAELINTTEIAQKGKQIMA